MKKKLVYAPYPYVFFDAIMESTIREMPQMQHSKVVRTTLSAGSCVYSVKTQKQLISIFTLRTTVDNQTAITVHSTDSEYEEAMLSFLAGIRTAATSVIASDKAMLSINELTPPQEITVFLDVLKEFYQTIFNDAEKRGGKPREPKQGDSVDTWLDWREEQIRRGGRRRAISLRAIAEQSGHSESTLKKRSAARHQAAINEPNEP
jgi:hypothetical protein